MASQKLVLFAIVLSLSAVVQSATHGQLAKSRTEIMQLGARLSAMEKSLGQYNDKYLASVEQIRLLEVDLMAYQQKLTEVSAQAQKKERELATILRAQVLANLEDEVPEQQGYLELVKQNRAAAEALSHESEALNRMVTQFQTRLENLRLDEQELMKIQAELAERKKEISDKYFSRLSERERIEAQLAKTRIGKKIQEARQLERETGAPEGVALKFAAPLGQWSQVLSSEKGVTYKFGQLQPIRAPRDGRVAYNGELASYGKVLMIDHGDDIRTVLLGKFSSDLEKNAQVRVGDVLGHTEQDTDSLYFEVRKKNVAQKTIHWLDEQATSKI